MLKPIDDIKNMLQKLSNGLGKDKHFIFASFECKKCGERYNQHILTGADEWICPNKDGEKSGDSQLDGEKSGHEAAAEVEKVNDFEGSSPSIDSNPSEKRILDTGVKINRIIEIYDNGHENIFDNTEEYFREINKELISEFIKKLRYNCICYDGSQTERNILKIIKEYEKS